VEQHSPSRDRPTEQDATEAAGLLPPGVTEYPQIAPDLPPPPAVAGGGGYGNYYASLQLEAQLRQLRERAERRAGSALVSMQLSAVLILLLTLYIASCTFILMSDTGPLQWPVWPVLALATPLLAAGVSYALLCFARAQQRFAYHYRRSWQRILHGELAQLFADDERLRLVQNALPSRFWGAAKARAPLSTVPQRIEFCAFHLPALCALLRNPERVDIARVRSGETTRQAAAQYDNVGLVWACCFGGFFLPWAWLALIVYGLVHGPRVIEGCAALCSFVDSCIEEPRLELAGLPPAEEPQGWWARLIAPWAYDGA
jgi:hypothetical protein